MRIQVLVKRLGRRGAGFEPSPFEILGPVGTVRELICACVETCVKKHGKRNVRTEPTPLDAEEISSMAQIGKIAFDIDYNGQVPSLEEAQRHALQCFDDGWFRVFLNDRELTGADMTITLKDNDVVSFIRLVMLSGRLW
ncbi:MAG: hypothetical protein K5663_08345 [Clostridiales bacterium]|nr:hypothetical protein [Clostridiales bacterium]